MEAIEFIPEKDASEYSKLQLQMLTNSVAYNNTQDFYIAYDGSYYYLVQLSQNKFDQLKEIHDYSYGKIDVAPKPVTITGMPVNIDNQLFKIVNESFNEITGENFTSTEFRDIIGYTYLDTSLGPMDERKDLIAIGLIASIISLIAFVPLWIIRYIRNRRFIDTYDSQLEEALRIQMAETKIYKKLKLIILKDYIIFDQGGIRVIPIEDILWAYPVDYKLKSIPYGKSIDIRLKNGKAYTIANIPRYLKSYKKIFDEAYMQLAESAPNAMFGHTPENQIAFKDLTK